MVLAVSRVFVSRWPLSHSVVFSGPLLAYTINLRVSGPFFGPTAQFVITGWNNKGTHRYAPFCRNRCGWARGAGGMLQLTGSGEESYRASAAVCARPVRTRPLHLLE